MSGNNGHPNDENAYERMLRQVRSLATDECEFNGEPCYGCRSCFAKETMRVLDAESKAKPTPQIRRHNGWDIRNADGLYWSNGIGEGEGVWKPVGMRWHGYSRKDMRQLAREVGGTLVRMTLVRRSKSGRTAIRCPDCGARERVAAGQKGGQP